MRPKIYFKSRRYPTDTQFRVKFTLPSGVLNFMQIMSVVIMFSLVFISQATQAQNVSKSTATQDSTQVIDGTVYDNDQNPLPGVTVRSKNGTAMTETQSNGKFTIRVPLRTVLTFQYVGYVGQEVQVNGTSLTVTMQVNNKNLDEVVVVAYGKTTQRKNTGALQQLDYRDVKETPVGQTMQKVQGQFAGVQIKQTSGTPGQGMQIKVRGAASISTGSDPLYVVDGFPLTGDRTINVINPDDIETITVLKDAASTALYGSRAAFGVVLITTKSAKKGKTQVSLNTQTGFSQVPMQGRPDMMNGQEWAQFKKESLEDLGQPVPEAFQNPAQYGAGYDWYAAMLRTGMTNNYGLSITSGTDKVSTAVTAGVFREKGVVLNSDFNRISLRDNNIFSVVNNLKFGFNVAPTYSYSNTPRVNGAFYGGNGYLNNAILTPPIVAFRNPDGSLPVSVTTPTVTSFPTPNWVRSIQDVTNTLQDFKTLANAYLEFTPIEGLTFRPSINLEFGQSGTFYFQPSTAGVAFATEPSQINANISQGKSTYYSWNFDNTLSYTKDFGEHNFETLVGFNAQKYYADYNGLSGSNFADDRIQTIGAALIKNNPSNGYDKWTLASYLARINYSFADKYLLSASIRRDGSSRFGSNNKYGNFPAVSAGWLASSENFLKNVQWLDLLKVRAGFGLTGNNNIGNYAQYARVTTFQSTFNNQVVSSAAVTSLGNSELGWERTKELNVGLDISVFKSRLNFTYDYYNKTTTNLLYGLSVPTESGFNTFLGNVGKINFWGHEIGINSVNTTGQFKWTSNANISFNRNKVLELSNLTNELYSGTGGLTSVTRVGYPIGQFYGLIQDGVYKNQTDYDNSPKNVGSQVGTIKYRDLNGDGVIKYGNADGDKTIIGNPYPKFIAGLTNRFDYKNFDLSAIATGSYGADIARGMDDGTTNLDGVFNVLKDVKDRWRSPSNPGAGLYGKTTAATADQRSQSSTFFIHNASYLTIKNVTLGYTLPTNAMQNYINSIRLYLGVQQLAVFTNYKGSNPEIGASTGGDQGNSLIQGVDYSAYPIPRTYTLGINVQFK